MPRRLKKTASTIYLVLFCATASRLSAERITAPAAVQAGVRTQEEQDKVSPARATPAGDKYKISSLSMSQARQRMRELEKERENRIGSLPLFKAKDMFETTAEYEKRKDAHDQQVRPLVAPIDAEIQDLKQSIYIAAGAKLTFSNYDADRLALYAIVSDQTLLSKKTVKAIVPISEAEEMHQEWAKVRIASPFFEQSSEPGFFVLLWNTAQYESTYTSFTDVYDVRTRGITEPKPVSTTPRPEYSNEGRAKCAQGTVVLSVIVLPDGTTKFESVKKGVGFGLDEQAIRAVEKWKFQPGQKDGMPIAVRIEVLTNFSLSRCRQ